MFTDSRSIDNRATAASFDTAYQKYAAATDTWFDGSPLSVENRLASCRRLMNIARSHVARRGAEVGPLTQLASLETDARVLTALREDLLTGAFDRQDNSPVAGVHIAVSEDYQRQQDWWDSMTEEQKENHKDGIERRKNERNSTENDYLFDEMGRYRRERFKGKEAAGELHPEHDGMAPWEESRADEAIEKASGLSPQDRRFVTLESAKFLSDNTDTNDVRELATRAMHHAQLATSTYDVTRSRIVTSAFVEKVAEGAKSRLREFILPLLQGIDHGMEGIEDMPTRGSRQEFLKGMGSGFRDAVPDSDEDFPEPPPGATLRDVAGPLLSGMGKEFAKHSSKKIDDLPPEALFF